MPPQEAVGAAREDRGTQGYHALRALIVRGRLAPGAWLIETEIAERIGMSRTPVRSALHRLLQEGYVIATGAGRRSRLVVAPLTKDDASELLHLLAEIEGLAAAYAAGLGDERRRRLTAELQQLNASLSAAARSQSRDADRYYELDHAFHGRYVEAAERPRILAMHRAVHPQAERYIRIYTTVLSDQIVTSISEHAAIIEGIARGHSAAAQRAARANFRNAAERLSKVIDAVGERGSWSVPELGAE